MMSSVFGIFWYVNFKLKKMYFKDKYENLCPLNILSLSIINAMKLGHLIIFL